ncbi:MAG: hypothetical protein A2583_14535 [Bdellovibrionales bacterium RIFOXYD1_FULL_53_11]|nr:MAG: hypothetical protein A2583_14535 [Bdellovibrionales bacterium RIFOXYD1_FULL_53_11]
MMMTFIVFFAFVINIGMLVNAKINLQNAADLAAYAGAAVQARQLNHISFLNYEMRRQYKKFLFRYYVLGGMAQKSFRTTSGPRLWSPDNLPANDFGKPAVCVIFNASDNYCHSVSLKKINIPPETVLDAINNTLRTQMQALEMIRQKSCKTIGILNMQLLIFWLFNTEDTLDGVSASMSASPEIKKQLAKIAGWAHGLGLFPREWILKKRIDALQYYVNLEPMTGVNAETANSLSASVDPARRERTILAFKSAYNTLGAHTFSDTESIVMDELLPHGADGANLLLLKPLKADLAAFAVDTGIGLPDSSSPAASDCQSVPIKLSAPNVPLGVVKDPSILTYYAIRLQAKAKVLFSPFGDINLKAYAAAQPFGSRIGPPLDPSNFYRTIDDVPTPGGPVAGRINLPNLAVKKGDSTAKGKGWDDQGVISKMFQAAFPSGIQAIGGQDLLAAYNIAMMPNPAEAGLYNIINDLGNDYMVKYFDETGKYAFWAPVFPVDKKGQGGDVQNEINEIVNEITMPGTAGQASGFSATMKEALKVGLTKYFGKLREGKGELGEGYNIAVLQDPMQKDKSGKLVSVPEATITDPKLIKTSWNMAKRQEIREQGRVGYSVKFISFASLLGKTGITSNGTDAWRNFFSVNDPDDEDVMNNITH